MAKAVKSKKEQVPETPQVAQMAQTPDSLAEIVETPEIGDVPQSVTLDEVKEVVTTKESLVNEVVKETPELNEEELSMEQKILKYLEDKPKVNIRINDFLKSLFKLPKFNELPIWSSQEASKELKNVLGSLQAEGSIEISNNAHLKLGTTYYPDTSTMRAEKHNIGTVPIYVIKKVN